ncbi:hypothetical protein NBRC116188_15600 [Oceaniserpentilla sp. 4NH20-0058]|uniref:hypothetical protein n=1 Tax=Oceaniserpentilla sp. 4NH20-0058 TaxID=3127660 RepID=UPI00310C50F3
MREELYYILNGVLFIKGVKKDLPRPVEEVLYSSEKIIFRYVVDGKTFDNRNIGAFSKNGDFLWFIEESCPKDKFNEYYKMYLNEDNELVSRIWAGQEFLIDSK